MTTVAGKPALGSIAARLERLPHSRWHVKVRFLIGAVTFFEAFDQLLAASALPVLMKEWNLSTGQATFAVTSASIGMLLGALAAGWLGDRIGRVRTVALGVAVTGLASLAVAFSGTIEMFSLFRFLQGLGIGGVVPVAATYINEIARSDKRGRFVLLYEMIFPAGLAAATLLAVWVVPAFGWRAMFLVGALPVVIGAMLPRHVEESPRWLLSRGRTAEAEAAIARIEAEVARATAEELPAPVPSADPPNEPKGTLMDLFRGRYLRRTAVLSGLWFVAYYVNHGISTWLPSLYTKEFGLDLTTALVYTLVSNVTGLLGTFVVAMLIDRIGRRPALIGAFVGTVLSLGVLALAGATSGGQVALFASCTTFFLYAINAGLYLYSPELYPTVNRAKGAAFGGLWNRFGVILGPVAVGAVLGAGGGLALVFAQLAVMGAVGAVIAWFAVETKGRTLEELNA
ncbi:MFS transporter, putative metabolite:H+ symporter [Streptomyces sp. LamerLS-316]|uniref:MFS transporter n=1 Tax=unclassified Streptomyces TaxID=2593676 RepID=UPI000823DA13|nr:MULTISPECIES: MFS transporter [unclassified Streptomyces]MYQ41084.1 MFS transporter [Streptomyces sp. SID4921]SCK07735.1 MFS transporter, putative metabolite:H+ symporter [Streptomyces sp. LamerLS-316]